MKEKEPGRSWRLMNMKNSEITRYRWSCVNFKKKIVKWKLSLRFQVVSEKALTSWKMKRVKELDWRNTKRNFSLWLRIFSQRLREPTSHCPSVAVQYISNGRMKKFRILTVQTSPHKNPQNTLTPPERNSCLSKVTQEEDSIWPRCMMDVANF